MSDGKSRLCAAAFLFASSTSVLAQSAASPDIVVTATRTPQPIQRAGSAITVITAEELEQSGMSPTRSLDDVFRRVPGVTLTQAGGAGQIQTVRIRGGDVRHTLVLIDGIRVNDPSSTGREFDFSTLVLADIERIEVLRGPQSALYGSDAMGGVINIITKRGRGAPKATVAVEGGSLGTKEMRAGVSGGTDRIDYSFGFSGLDASGFSSFGHRIGRLQRFAPPNGFEPDSARRLGATGRVGVKLADDVRLEVGGGSSFNRAQYDAAFLPFPDTDSLAKSHLHNGYGRLIGDAFGGTLRNTVTVFGNRVERRFRDEFLGPFGGTSRTDFMGERTGAEYQGDLALGAFGLLTFGAKAERELADSFRESLSPFPSPRMRTIAAEQTTQSAFALHQITLGNRLHLSLGGRIDDVTSPDRLVIGPDANGSSTLDRFATWRATAAYEIFETGTKLRASAGTGGKAPSLFQLFSPEFGTPTLESERSIGVDAGVDQALLDGRVNVSATVFHNRYRDLIDFALNPGCRPDQAFGCYFNVARAETTGLELSGDLIIVPELLRTRLTYTHMKATGQTFDPLTGEFGESFELARRPKDEGRVGLVVTPNPRLSIQPSVVFVGHRYSSFNETDKLSPYARLDLYMDYKLDDNFTLYVRGENLTDTRYEEVRNFGTAGVSFYGGVRATW
ncbi:MAG TPA: TonB-dependent receptor [Beijerinckiaceae bacterium]|nr:TonB-dependent receptor [Beijerinckiaceae bacterium]